MNSQIESKKQIESQKDELNSKLSDANDRIQTLEEDVRVNQESIDTLMDDEFNPVELKIKNQEQQAELNNLKKEKVKLLGLRDKLVENNENLKNRNQKLNDTIESIYSSNSWKLTSSLRNMKRKI